MSDLNDHNTRVAAVQATERVTQLLHRFSYDGASWDDYPSMNETAYLNHLRLDLDMLTAAVEQRIQETGQTHEPTDFGAAVT
jgi:hypothetical protein